MSKIDGIINSLEPFVHGLGKAVLRELREALAQPAGEAEPVYQAEFDGGWHDIKRDDLWKYQDPHWPDCPIRTLYTTPQQSQPLTDEQIMDIQGKYVGWPTPSFPLDTSDWLQFARAIEAAHGIKKGGTE